MKKLIIYCDRCGKESLKKDNPAELRYELALIEVISGKDTGKDFDLCPDCKQSLREWLEKSFWKAQ